MLQTIAHYLGLERHSHYLRSYLVRSNLEVMRPVSLFFVLVGLLGFVSTFFPLDFWMMPPDLLAVNRALFIVLSLVSLVFGVLCRVLLRRDELRPAAAQLLMFSLISSVLVLAEWVTLLDFSSMKRYFYLLTVLIVTYGLFFIPPFCSLLSMLVIVIVTLTGLSATGNFSPVQAITLVIYCCVLAAVSAATYHSRLRSGLVNEATRRTARHDELTGVRNRLALDEDVHHLIRQDLHLIISDIDDFKNYNDLYGHEVGDLILQGYAHALSDAFGCSHVYRYGGDEFVVVVRGMGADELKQRVAQWRGAFHELAISGVSNHPTCSAGIVSCHPNDRQEFFEALQGADLMLYRAKDAGRNCVKMSAYTPELLAESMAKASERSAGRAKLDQLTGLPDAEFFYAHAEDLLPAMARKGSPTNIVYFNVDGLKDYNARHSYEEGDQLLRFVAQTISDVFPNRLLARFGDDRFVLLVEEEGLLEALEHAHAVVLDYRDGQLTSLRAGIARVMGANPDIRGFCDCARLACDSIRGRYNVFYRHYTDELGRELATRQRVLERFEGALANGHIQAYYQPIVRSVSDLVCEFETLARWDDPNEGLMEPDAFVPALEEARLVHLLDLHVIELVCQHYHRLREAGLPTCPASVNLSVLDFEAPEFFARLRDLLETYHIPARTLRAEITETAFTHNPKKVGQGVRKLHELGLQVWMDDFGSGYSSLSVLRDNEFDAVKIDMGFLRGINGADGGQRSRIMLTHFVGMGKELGIQTVAEGAESLEQLLFLRNIGCEKVQGHVFSEPVTFDQVVEYLRSNVFYVEDEHFESYYRTVGRVNLMKPFDTTRDPDYTGVGDGLPVAVVEWDGQLAHCLLTSKPFLNNLSEFGYNDVVDFELRLNEEQNPHPLRVALPEVVKGTDWVRIDIGGAPDRRYGYARRLAACDDSRVFAVLYVAPIAPQYE